MKTLNATKLTEFVIGRDQVDAIAEKQAKALQKTVDTDKVLSKFPASQRQYFLAKLLETMVNHLAKAGAV